MATSPRLVALFLFGSGLTALIYQTAWQRALRLVFGASTAASSAVIAIFLGGLGLGGAWLGKRAERSARPLLYYAQLELGVAVTAALTPLWIELIGRVYLALGGSVTLGGGATPLRLVLASLAIGPPVVLMGGSLPAAARAVEIEEDKARGRTAVLFVANTLGALVGALLGTFVLFEHFGTRLSLWTAALVNLLVALGARRAAASMGGTAPQAEGDVPLRRARHAGFVYAVAAAVGFAFVAMELVWYRMLAPVLGGSTFTFGLVLAVALAGLTIGGWMYARRGEKRAVTTSLLGVTLALEAAFAAFPFWLGDRVAFCAAVARGLVVLGFTALAVGWALIATLVVLPASIAAGYQFPVLIGLLGQGKRRVAEQVGLVYAWNTLGAICGALVTGFWLIPRLGAVSTWRSISVLLVCLSASAVALSLRSRRALKLGRTAISVAAIAAALLCSAAQGPTAAWRHTAIGAGSAPIPYRANGFEAWRRMQAVGVVWQRDGVESAIALQNFHGVSFIVNGKSDGAVLGDRGTQGLLALLPAILHPAPRDVFVLGLGTGMTAGWAAAVPGVERVDVAELEPAVRYVAERSSPANQNVLGRANVHVFQGDGREFLLASRRSYDIVVSEPSNPYRAGVASLFTREFYEAVSRRLRPGGLFGQWVQAYDIDAGLLRVVLRTLGSAFPVVELWQTQAGDLLLIASLGKKPYDVNGIRDRASREPFRSGLLRTGYVEGAEGVLAHFMLPDSLTRKMGLAFDTPVNTDDRTILEYAFVRAQRSGKSEIPTQLLGLSVHMRARPDVVGDLDWPRVDELRQRVWLVSGDPAAPPTTTDPAVFERMQAVKAACTGRPEQVLSHWERQPGSPRDLVETYALAEGYANGGDDRTLPLSESLEKQGYGAEAALVRARFNTVRRLRPQALEAALQGVDELRKTALPLCRTAEQVLILLRHIATGDHAMERRAIQALLQGPLAVDAEEELRLRTVQALAFALGDPAICVSALGSQVEHPWWEGDFLQQRAQCLSAVRHPLAARAEADAREFVEGDLGNVADGVAPEEVPPLVGPLSPAPDDTAAPGPHN